MSTTRMLIALGLILTAARADVVVIDPAGGPGEPVLKRALAAAAPGDVLLLEPGDYVQEYFVYVIDKGITLMPASPTARIVLGPVQIQDFPAGQTAVLRGFDVQAQDGSVALQIFAIRGTAWIEDCQFTGGSGEPAWGSIPAGGGGIAVDVNQARAIFRHCSLAGGAGGDTVSDFKATPGGDALHVAALSYVALYDCTLVGGDFGSGLSPFNQGFGLGGGHALDASFADVTVSGCTLIGGKEGADNDALPGTSGSAIRTFDHTGVRVLQSVLMPGAVQGAGTQAPAVVGPAAAVTMLAEPARSLVLPALAQVGQVVTLSLDGEPGDVALLMMSAEATALPVKRYEGTLALQPGSFAAPVSVGVLPGPDGQLSLPLAIAGLPPGVEGMTFFAQALFQDADGASLGGSSAITWLAAGG